MVKRVLVFALVALSVVPAFAEEPIVTPIQECQAALEFNKTDFMRMRDQFARVAIQADALKKQVEELKKKVAGLTPKEEPKDEPKPESK